MKPNFLLIRFISNFNQSVPLSLPSIKLKPFCHTMEAKNYLSNEKPMQSGIAYIDSPPENPVEMWSELNKAANSRFVTMNLATLDAQTRATNRLVVYRGLTDGHITFVTERNSQKYVHIMNNPYVAITVFLGMINFKGSQSTWQIRLLGKAVELNADQISKLWQEEPVFAKIRSRICECGKPVDYEKLKEAHDTLLKAFEDGKDTLPQTETFTGFKIIPTTWDFYKSERSLIADRVVYTKKDDDSWERVHVAA